MTELELMGPGPWALGPGPWALGRGPRALGRGPRALGRGPWALGHGPWLHGPWAMDFHGILIEGARFPPLGFDIAEVSSNSKEDM